MCIIGSGISFFKILLVTHFYMIFNQDPERLGKKVLLFSLFMGIVPHCVICIFQSINGTKALPIAAYFMGEKLIAELPSPMQVYGSTWFVISVAMLLTAVVFIPNYSKRRSLAAILASEHQEKMNSISIVRVLLGTSGVTFVVVFNIIAQSIGLTTQFPVHVLLAAILLCLQLLIFVLHKNIVKYIKKKILLNLPGCYPIIKCKNKITPSV
jgi:hypothetical protein